MSQDRWCPNCEQNVRPRERHGVQTWAIGVVVWLLSGLLYNRLGWFGGYSGIASAVTALIVAPQFGDRYKVRTCPICGTNSLSDARPSGTTEVAEERQPNAGPVSGDVHALGQRLDAEVKAGERSIGSLSREERRALIAYRRSQGGLMGAFMSGFREGRKEN